MAYHGELFNFILSKVGDKDTAKDILQEVSVKYHLALEKRTIEDHRAWLFKVARNTIADYYRRQKSEIQALENGKAGIPESYEHCVCDVAGFVIKNYLSPEYAGPLYLSDIENLSQQEVADKLNLSLTATKSRIQRARKQLKQLVEDCLEVEKNSKGQVTGYELKNNCILPPELVQELRNLKLFL